MIWRMATPFDTDYSFLNLPEMGSDVRGPIDLPSFEPVDFSFNIDQYAPERLPETELVQPSLDPFSVEENQELLSSARPFEDIQALGATFGQRLAETEKFFGDRISDLQNNISDLEGAKSNLTGELESAISEQDVIRQQSAEEQMQALDAQRAELEAQLQSAVAEAEANGVNALEAAKASAADKIGQLDAEIARTTEDLQNAIAEQDVIRQQADQQRLTELETQKENLTVQFQEQTASLEQKFGAREAELEGQIGNLQGEINALTGARDAALAERDNAIAQQDTIRAEAAEQQAQALDAQAADYQSQLDELTGSAGQKDQTISDLQAQLAALQGEAPPAGTPGQADSGPPLNYMEFIEAGNKPADYNQYMANYMQQNPDYRSPYDPRGTTDDGTAVIAGDPSAPKYEDPDDYAPSPPGMNVPGGGDIPPKPPQLPPKRSDQIFIDDMPRFISEERPLLKPIRKPVDPGRRFNDLQNIIEPRDTNIMPKNRADLIPVIRPGTGFIGGPVTVADTPFTGAGMAGAGTRPDLPPPNESALFGKRPTIRRPATPIPQAPAITPPRRPMSVGGIGGFAGKRSGRMIRR